MRTPRVSGDWPCRRDRDVGRFGAALGGLGDLDLEGLLAANKAETRGGDDLKPAIVLTRLTGNESMHRRLEAKRCGGAGHIMHLALGDEDRAGEAVARHIRQALGEIGEEHGPVAIGVAGRRGGAYPADVEVGNRLQFLAEFLAEFLGAVGATGDGLALTLVDDDGDDVVEGLAILLLELRVGDREHEQNEARKAQHGAAARAPKEEREQEHANASQHPENGPRHERQEFEGPLHPTGPTFRGGQEREPGRPCSCRSARTSRC